MFKIVISMYEIGETLIVNYSDGTFKNHNAIELAKDWLRLSNDSFYSLYGFNYVPSEMIMDRARKNRL